MKKVFNYGIFILLLSFIFVINVNAECSYQERKQLLNEAKAVDISVNPKIVKKQTTIISDLTEEEETIEYDTYSFDFNIVNLTDNLFVKYYNDIDGVEMYLTFSDLNDGLYTFTDNNETTLVNYYFEFRSQNDNCPGQLMYTKKVVKPIFNNFSIYSVCEEDELNETEYCQKFTTKDFGITENEFLEWANKEKTSTSHVEKDNESNILEIIVDKWYIGLIVFFILVIIGIVLYIKKRRSEL